MSIFKHLGKKELAWVHHSVSDQIRGQANMSKLVNMIRIKKVSLKASGIFHIQLSVLLGFLHSEF